MSLRFRILLRTDLRDKASIKKNIQHSTTLKKCTVDIKLRKVSTNVSTVHRAMCTVPHFNFLLLSNL